MALLAWVSSSTSGPRDAARARGVRGARAQPHHHQLNPHVRLPADPPAGRVRASRQAPAQEEGANARVRARAATAAAATLYLLLMFQMALYLLYTIVEVDWSMLLVVIAGYYLDAKKRNFMLMYLVVVSVTVLLDVIKIAAMPNLDTMTPGAAFGAVLYFFIFVLKFAIVGAIYLYQRKEDSSPTAFAFSQMPDGAGRGDDEIAE